jgi:hypothetical protein
VTHEIIIPAIVRAAQRAPTPAGLASVEAALTGRPTPAAQFRSRPADLDGADDLGRLPVAALPAAPPPPDPHEPGQPDPSLDWMFR